MEENIIENPTRWQRFKQYVKSPPPSVIAQTEYRGHFLNILGILVVSVVLFIKGVWYIIFGFIFMTMVSWAQGMAALARYRVFTSFLQPETYEYILTDKSFTRRRQRLLKKRYPKAIRWIILFSCFSIAIGILGYRKITYLYTAEVFGVTMIIYFMFTYLLLTWIIQKVKMEEYKDVIQAKASQNTDA